MDDMRVDRPGRAPAPAASGPKSCKRCATGRCSAHGHIKGGRETGLIAFIAAAGVLAALRPDLYAGLVEHASVVFAGLVG
ncbi:hypothetical protein P8605_13570 [Streptomyces sp. T-3]|nr:hypothetical protein [Streptomyces sp. T-3]